MKCVSSMNPLVFTNKHLQYAMKFNEEINYLDTRRLDVVAADVILFDVGSFSVY